MEIQERIINWGHGYMEPQYLVIHETANPGATALMRLVGSSEECEHGLRP